MYLIDYEIKKENIAVTTITDRMMLLKKWSIQGKRTVLYLKDRFDVPTHRYRAYNMIESMNESENWRATYALRNEIPFLSCCLDAISILIIVRMECDKNVEKLINSCKERKIATCLNLDDMVYDINQLELLMESTQIYHRDNWEKVLVR